MTFGKHRGKFLEDVPTQYLQWCMAECDNLDHCLRVAIDSELHSRGEPTRPRKRRRPQPFQEQPQGATAGGLVPIRDVIQRWWREQALKHHPDRGGQTAVMQALNEAHDRLKQLAGVA